MERLIQFRQIGELSTGYISVAEVADECPFDIKRVFWTYHTPESIVRGRHAHKTTEQILIALSGRIIVTIEDAKGDIRSYNLESPSVGLYIPPSVWHTMQYSHTAIQLVLASTHYEEADYFRDVDEFYKYWR